MRKLSIFDGKLSFSRWNCDKLYFLMKKSGKDAEKGLFIVFVQGFSALIWLSGKVWSPFNCRMLPVTINRRLPATVVEQPSSDGDHGTARGGSWLTTPRFTLRVHLFYLVEEGHRILNLTQTFLGLILVQALALSRQVNWPWAATSHQRWSSKERLS